MTDRSAFDPFAPAEVSAERAETAAQTSRDIIAAKHLELQAANGYGEPTHAEHVAFIASELEAGLARKGIDV
jgi:hypothetical protein